MTNRQYQINDDQLSKLKACVESIAQALESLQAASPQEPALLEQINGANRTASQILQDIQREPPRPIGTRTPPRESNVLAKRGKKGPLY